MKHPKTTILCLLIAVSLSNVLASRSGAKRMNFWGPDAVKATVGMPWPLPQKIESSGGNLTVNSDPSKFTFSYSGDCKIVKDALVRYKAIIFGQHPSEEETNYDYVDKDSALTALKVQISGACEQWPHFAMDEAYTLMVDENKPSNSKLMAQSVWGALRGLATFSQLFVYEGTKLNPSCIKAKAIRDWPRFPHRGLLIDTSRHFIPIPIIMKNLEMMEHSKYNVLHWHIVDDPSFPFESSTFPELSKKGAFSDAHVYHISDVAHVIDQARSRGIRVVAEFDSPGHTQSWGAGKPELLSECFDDLGLKTGQRALLNPFELATYDTVLALFTEILQRFPDRYIHLGGDEVSYQYKCWTNNPKIKEQMALYNFTKGDQIENFYFQKFIPLVERARKNTGYIVWQEVLDNHVKLPDDVIAHVWKGGSQALIDKEMADVTSRGHRALLSSCWYLNYISYGNDWRKWYTCEPQNFNGTEEQKRLVVGGEACIWGEYVDATNILPRLWSRAALVGERLWSDRAQTQSADKAAPRLEEHRCRMLRLGYPVEPMNGPGYCPVEWSGY